MERMRWENHKGKKILFNDYSGLKEQNEYVKTIDNLTEAVAVEIKKEMPVPEKSTLFLIDVRDSIIGSNVITAFKTSSQVSQPLSRKMAVVGIRGIRKILLDTINRVSGIGARPFLEIEDAKNWLAE